MKRGAIIETPLLFQLLERCSDYLSARLMPNALLEPSQLQFPPQPDDLPESEPPLPQPQPPLPPTCLNILKPI